MMHVCMELWAFYSLESDKNVKTLTVKKKVSNHRKKKRKTVNLLTLCESYSSLISLSMPAVASQKCTKSPALKGKNKRKTNKTSRKKNCTVSGTERFWSTILGETSQKFPNIVKGCIST